MEREGAGGSGRGLVMGVEESIMVKHAREEVNKGHVGFVGEGGGKIFVAYSLDAGDERKVGNDGGGEVMAEGADVLDEEGCGTGLAEVAKLFEDQGGNEKHGADDVARRRWSRRRRCHGTAATEVLMTAVMTWHGTEGHGDEGGANRSDTSVTSVRLRTHLFLSKGESSSRLAVTAEAEKIVRHVRHLAVLVLIDAIDLDSLLVAVSKGIPFREKFHPFSEEELTEVHKLMEDLDPMSSEDHAFLLMAWAVVLCLFSSLPDVSSSSVSSLTVEMSKQRSEDGAAISHLRLGMCCLRQKNGLVK
ncbi:hypothetical protein CBR_g66117 [Chara braunii]|uniref:Uncharacterized protein n=1 Tax=Chara braunii TaxID=69332 RepID=A0A388MFV0_CHABU|nr:hypothetical protein CBR_g66117 [Chara braunii]|eukprot:GBG93352.1 hypothetical protein CBR_g66117 [Chara braunii]